MDREKTLFLLDAYALIFRSYYAFIRNPIKNSKGFNTSVIFGFVNTLDEIIKKENPTHIGVVFDPPTPTFRNELYPAYKANRDETPEDIISSVPYIKKIIAAYNIPILEIDGFEADDVIGTLAKKAEAEGYTVFMMTPDKDYAQLVSENVFMYVPRKSGAEVERWGIEQIREKFLVDEAIQVIDVLALWGDASDNVPGVAGIGEKTAKKLISEYKSVENILANLESFKGKQKENLENSIEQLKLSKILVTIDVNVPVEFDPVKLTREECRMEELIPVFQELEFRTLIARLTGQPSQTRKSATEQPPAERNLFSDTTLQEAGFASSQDIDTIRNIKKDYILIQTGAEVLKLVDEIRKSGVFCFDTETTHLEIHEARLVGMSFSMKAHKAFYLPFPGDMDRVKEILEPLRSVLADKSIMKVGQNLKYDIKILMNYGLQVNGELFDTMVAHYLLRPEQRHNLNILSETYLKYRPVSIEELIGPKGNKQGNMQNVPLEKIKDYACEDADLTWQLYLILQKELKNEGLLDLAQEIEMPLILVLAAMEYSGIRIDITSLSHYGVQLTKEILSSEKQIFSFARCEFNISSPKQLGEILFDRLKISDGAKKTKTKQYSTAEDTLSKLIDKHPIVAEVLNYRSLKKLLSTYIEALPKLISPTTGKLHTSFNQTIASTGRLSSTNPNLQNIPIREERGREIRKAFIPSRDKDGIIISADYSQIELRIMAYLSKDQNMMDAFQKGEDIHTATAAKIHGISLTEVTKDMRSAAKTANFGIIYGISAFGLSQRMDINRTEARELIDGYFNTFPQVREYMDESIRMAREKGYAITLMGRKRLLPDINSRNANIRGMAERNAINAPIQGSAADIIKIAMINIRSAMEEEKMTSKMVLQVHDELVFDAIESEVSLLKKIIKEKMEAAYNIIIPLNIEMGSGKNWLEAHS